MATQEPMVSQSVMILCNHIGKTGEKTVVKVCAVMVMFILLFSCTAHSGYRNIAMSPKQLDASMQIYSLHCSGCHGPNGEGVVGPALSAKSLRKTYPNQSVQAALIIKGTGRGMPPFENLLSAEQIQLLVEYTRQL